MKRITVMGTGFGGLTAISTLRKLEPSAEITVIGKQPAFFYYPSLIWIPSGLRSGDDITVNLENFFPLFLYHRWQANLRILDVDEIKTVPYTPLSHPFVERLTGTIHREYLDHTLFWNAIDPERKLADFQAYYNHHRTHRSLDGDTPAEIAGGTPKPQPKLKDFRWQNHCRGIYQLPAAA